MPSSSTSEPILSVRGLHLAFRTSLYRAWTLRDLFTRAASRPSQLLPPREKPIVVARGLSLELRHGDRLALIGANGTGKTSLCRCIAGIYEPTDGEIEVRGRMRSVFDTGVGIVPELTGRENAELLSAFLFPDDPDREALVREALEFSELGKFVDVPFRLYSNGMQARLYLSLVSSRPAELFLLDEVFEGADAFFREKIAARMLKVLDHSGAVIFVSHAEDQLRRVCNRAAVLEDGRFVFEGSVDQALAHYHRRHAAP
jgi:ABC-type polysaccharide/polyol phosphate transport system ATPase subunit